VDAHLSNGVTVVYFYLFQDELGEYDSIMDDRSIVSFISKA